MDIKRPATECRRRCNRRLCSRRCPRRGLCRRNQLRSAMRRFLRLLLVRAGFECLGEDNLLQMYETYLKFLKTKITQTYDWPTQKGSYST